MSAHASASQPGATSSILRPRAWVGGAFVALLALAIWLGSGARDAAAAAECPNEAIRIAQGATRLPDCRAYERVSPADSTGGVVGVDTSNRPVFGAIRADGNAAAFGSSSGVGDSERGALKTSNLAHRSATGWDSFGIWTTTQVDIPVDGSMAPTRLLPSPDMSRTMFSPSRSLGPPNPITTGGSIYLSAVEGKGPPTWLSSWSSEGVQPNPSGAVLPLGGSADFSSGYFNYPTRLTSLAGDNLRTSQYGLYFFSGSGISPAGILPSGTVSPEGALPAGSTNTGTTLSVTTNLAEQQRNQVSADGSKLFFVSPAEGAGVKQLYVQEGSAPGRLISHDTEGNPALTGVESLAAGAAGNGTRTGYAFATPDGSRVLFRSAAALTDDAPGEGIKTYRAEITPSSIELEYLPMVTGYVMAIDADASAILFSTVVDATHRDYYIWNEDRPGDAPYPVGINLEVSNISAKPVYEPNLSDDGSALVFSSDLELEPGMTALPEINYLQVYRWTEQDPTLTCISCRRDGVTPAVYGSRMTTFNGLRTDNAAFPAGVLVDASTQSSVVGNRKISSDGSRVFFDTSDPLDPARDVNGTRDVYMWESGQVHLLTSGHGSRPSYVIDSSESGSDVMLVTMDGLIPSDANQSYDVYDVRVDGGFDESVEAGCEGDACHPPGSGGPAATAPGSIGLLAAGNQHQTRLGQVKVAQLGKPGSSARVRVNVPAAGRVKLAGNLVRNRAKGVKAQGAVTLQVALNKAGKRKLAAKGQLATKVITTFRDGDGRIKQSTVTLRFKQGGHR